MCGVIVCYFLCVCVLVWPSLAPCEGQFEVLCELFLSINYATTCLDNPDGHSLKSGGAFDGVYCV